MDESRARREAAFFICSICMPAGWYAVKIPVLRQESGCGPRNTLSVIAQWMKKDTLSYKRVESWELRVEMNFVKKTMGSQLDRLYKSQLSTLNSQLSFCVKVSFQFFRLNGPKK